VEDDRFPDIVDNDFAQVASSNLFLELLAHGQVHRSIDVLFKNAKSSSHFIAARPTKAEPRLGKKLQIGPAHFKAACHFPILR